MTGSAFDFIKIPMHCPQCGKDPLQPLREMLAADGIACTFCGSLFDLKNETIQAFLRKQAAIYRKIKPPSTL